MRVKSSACFVLAALLLIGTVIQAAEKGAPDLKSAGPLAFGPDGVLFVGDTKAATLFAIETGDKKGEPAKVELNIEGLNKKVADKLGGSTSEVQINDLAVNPKSGNIYLSVSKGQEPVLMRIDGTGKLSPLSLEKVVFSKVELPNAPEDKVVGEGRRARNNRAESITDLAYVEGKVIVSGMSSDKSPSTVREIAYPFAKADKGMNIEIFHGAHGRLENNAVIRTFVPFNIDGEANLLAGFTCTPLVKFPVASIGSKETVRGTTVAELGNRNRPLDMIVYKKGGKDFLLMANSSRGVMKISTDDIENNEGITEPVRGGGTAGQKYETIEDLKGVVQLDRLNDEHAVVLVQQENGSQDLQTIALP